MKETGTADALSRGRIISTEWSLRPLRPSAWVAQPLFLLIDWPSVDLFAPLANKQLPIYCARGLADRRTGHALRRAADVRLRHLPHYGGADRDRAGFLQGSLIAIWPPQPWFPGLVRLLAHRPMVLLNDRTLYTSPDP